MKQTLTIIDATPAMADVVSGNVPMPTDCPRFGKREWATKTPAWPRFEAQMGRKLVADGSPELDAEERAAGFSVAFTVWLNKYDAMVVFLNSDGTRMGYYA
jgi:hypothetical protein